MNLSNMPELKLGIVAVSRDCFPMSLSENRRKAVVEAYKKNFNGEIYECPVIVESETDMMKASRDLREAGCNAQVVYLGNFGPETEETMLVKAFHRSVYGSCSSRRGKSGTGQRRCLLRYVKCKLQLEAA